MDDEAERVACACCDFLARYGGIGEFLPNDFFTTEHWQTRLSASARASLLATPLDELVARVVAPEGASAGAPAAAGHDERSHAGPHSEVLDDPFEMIRASHRCRLRPSLALSVEEWRSQRGLAPAPERAERAAEQHERHLSLLSAKKAHEVRRLACLVDALAELAPRGGREGVHVVDVGAGKGYLGSYLSLAAGMRVTSVDGRDANVCGAARRHALVARALGRAPQHGGARHDVRLAWLDRSSAELAAGRGTAREGDGDTTEAAPARAAADRRRAAAAPAEAPAAAETGAIILTGLHACGDLTPTLLHSFVCSPRAHALAVVGCCLQLMGETGGFPLSAHVADYLRSRGLTGPRLLSRRLRLLAAKAPAREAGRGGAPVAGAHAAGQASGRGGARARTGPAIDHDGTPAAAAAAAAAPAADGGRAALSGDERALWRPLLSLVLWERFGVREAAEEDGVAAGRADADAHAQAGGSGAQQRQAAVRVGKLARKCASFSEFARRAVEKLGVGDPAAAGTDDELSALAALGMQRAAELHRLEALRLACAPVIEALVALDRLLFLRESAGCTGAWLVRAFDEAVSPRALALVAIRHVECPP